MNAIETTLKRSFFDFSTKPTVANVDNKVTVQPTVQLAGKTYIKKTKRVKKLYSLVLKQRNKANYKRMEHHSPNKTYWLSLDSPN